jgi:hypothetical protein
MRRLNVRSAQIDECITKSLFAISYRPLNPELHARLDTRSPLHCAKPHELEDIPSLALR